MGKMTQYLEFALKYFKTNKGVYRTGKNEIEKLIIPETWWCMVIYTRCMREHYNTIFVKNFKFYYHNTTKIKMGKINS